MKNESSSERRERTQAERTEEDRRMADAAATDAARTRLATEAEARKNEEDRLMAEAQRPEADEADRADGTVTWRELRLMTGVDKDADEKSALPLWELRAKNHDAPPFHFTNVAVRVVVAAASAEEARHIVSGVAGEHGVSWLDDTQTDCVELRRTEPGLIAQDLGA